MAQHEPTPEDYLKIAEKVRSGEYFREARQMYDLDVHAPMTDRYWYVILTLIAVVTVTVAFTALGSLYPLNTKIPFIYGSKDIVDELPRIKTLRGYGGEEANAALKRFLLTNYTKAREEYNILTFEKNQNTVASQSNPEVTAKFRQDISPTNPKSPVALYQRSIIRTIEILRAEESVEPPGRMTIIYNATLKGAKDNTTKQYKADIAFVYETIKLDEETNKVEPYRFMVTDYRSQFIGDAR
jgi:type IV secretory pathway component VirB8